MMANSAVSGFRSSGFVSGPTYSCAAMRPRASTGESASLPLPKARAGNPKFARNIVKMNDTADPVALIRNALSAQFDQNAIVLLTGPATNLAGLLALPGAPPL